ncbi:MAG: hypothetical protein ACE5I7_20130 [Candidatus Binatia bacterium]
MPNDRLCNALGIWQIDRASVGMAQGYEAYAVSAPCGNKREVGEVLGPMRRAVAVQDMAQHARDMRLKILFRLT